MTDWWHRPLDRDALARARRLVEAAGLVKVYDGQRFIDLRDVTRAVIDLAVAQQDDLEDLQARLLAPREPYGDGADFR